MDIFWETPERLILGVNQVIRLHCTSHRHGAVPAWFREQTTCAVRVSSLVSWSHPCHCRRQSYHPVHLSSQNIAAAISQSAQPPLELGTRLHMSELIMAQSLGFLLKQLGCDFFFLLGFWSATRALSFQFMLSLWLLRSVLWLFSSWFFHWMLVPFMGTEVTRLLDWEQQQQRQDWKGKKRKYHWRNHSHKSVNSMQFANPVFHSENEQTILAGGSKCFILGYKQFSWSNITNTENQAQAVPLI